MGVRELFRSVEAGTPTLAAMIAQQLFALTRPAPISDREGILGEAIAFRVGGLRAWSWGYGPKVLLVHGWNGFGTQFESLVETLVANRYQPIAFDFPARSDVRNWRTTLQKMADAIVTIGRSLGDIHAVVAHALGTAATSTAMARGFHAEQAVYFAPGPANLRALEGAPTIHADLLVIHDEEDPQIHWTVGRDIVYAWPSARLIRTSGLGHNGILRDPLVLKHVRRFIGERPLSSVA